MVGRGELGFVMAEEGYARGVTSKLTFSVTVWALLLATLLSPIALGRVLARQPQVDGDGDDHAGGGCDSGDAGSTAAGSSLSVTGMGKDVVVEASVTC